VAWIGRVFPLLLAAGLGAALAQGTAPARAALSGASQPARPAAPLHAAGPAPAAASVSTDYKLGADDVLNIEVWHEPDISGKVPVRPDGKISVPLVGEVQAAGETALQLQATITAGLKAYIDDPAVTVVVEQVNSRKVNVLGRVLHPGTYSLGTKVNVLDALAMAGGPVPFAHLSKIYVLRTPATGRVQRLPFDYNRVISGQRPDENVQLLPGDTIVVP